MEAVTEHLKSESIPSLPQAMSEFFARFTSEETYTLIVFHLFKAWVCQPKENKKYDEKKLALFCDQLINLVAAADQLHQGNRVSEDLEKGVCGD